MTLSRYFLSLAFLIKLTECVDKFYYMHICLLFVISGQSDMKNIMSHVKNIMSCMENIMRDSVCEVNRREGMMLC